MLITVTVKPGSRHETVLESDGGFLIYTHAIAESGKANRRAIELLARHLSIPASSVSVKSGAHYRRKIVEIDDHVL